MRLEGLVGKRVDSRDEPGKRTRLWLKVKCQEWTPWSWCCSCERGLVFVLVVAAGEENGGERKEERRQPSQPRFESKSLRRVIATGVAD